MCWGKGPQVWLSQYISRMLLLAATLTEVLDSILLVHSETVMRMKYHHLLTSAASRSCLDNLFEGLLSNFNSWLLFCVCWLQAKLCGGLELCVLSWLLLSFTDQLQLARHPL